MSKNKFPKGHYGKVWFVFIFASVAVLIGIVGTVVSLENTLTSSYASYESDLR